MDYPPVSIISPIMHFERDFEEFLESINNLKFPKHKLKVIIIINSNQRLSSSIKKKFPWVAFLEPKQNLGFAKAVNLGIEKTDSQYLFIGNEDLVMTPQSLKKMVAKLENDKTIGVLGGKIFFKDKPQLIASHGHDFNFRLGLVKDDPSSPDIEKEPLWVDGCAMLISRSVLNKIGLFDVRFFPVYFEDADLCLRVKKAGFRVVYDPTIFFYHGQSKSFSKFPAWKKYCYWYKNKTIFMLKNFLFFLRQ
jgi:hypothetical protein